jgi:hypothetical protein
MFASQAARADVLKPAAAATSTLYVDKGFAAMGKAL